MKARWNPENYAANSQGQAIWANELIAKIGLRGDEAILDIGCGDGKITDALSRLTYKETIAIDLSAEMVAFAQSHFKTPLFMQMDAQQLTFDARFDVVFSNAALHWVANHEAVVRGIYRALKPGGKAVLQMGGKGNAAAVFAALEKVKVSYARYFEGFQAPYTFCSNRQYTLWLKDAGFREYHAALLEKEMVHENVDAFKGWLHTTWFPFIQRVPEAMQAAFVDAWVTAYLDTRPVDDMGRIRVAMVRLEVMAIK